MKEPVVSVLVPIFNHERFLGRCLRSLLNQTLERASFEIIAVDDGSTDNSASVARQFGDKLKIASHASNLGLPSALNTALSVAAGELVVRVDSDDYVNANFLKSLTEHLMKAQTVDAVACDYVVVDDNESVIEVVDCEARPIGCGILFRKRDVLEVGGYDPEFIRAEDAEFRLRFEERYQIARLDVPLYRYRRHETNITNDLALMTAYLDRVHEKAREP